MFFKSSNYLIAYLKSRDALETLTLFRRKKSVEIKIFIYLMRCSIFSKNLPLFVTNLISHEPHESKMKLKISATRNDSVKWGKAKAKAVEKIELDLKTWETQSKRTKVLTSPSNALWKDLHSFSIKLSCQRSNRFFSESFFHHKLGKIRPFNINLIS